MSSCLVGVFVRRKEIQRIKKSNRESKEDGGFSNSRVSDQEDLEQIVTIVVSLRGKKVLLVCHYVNKNILL